MLLDRGHVEIGGCLSYGSVDRRGCFVGGGDSRPGGYSPGGLSRSGLPLRLLGLATTSDEPLFIADRATVRSWGHDLNRATFRIAVVRIVL